jgi:phage major head subunit gpT-like protein
MLINRANLNDMFRGFQLLFGSAFDAAPSQWDRIAMRVPSTTAEEKYAWLGKMSRFREWVGDRVFNSLKTHDYTIKNRKWENSVEVDRADIEDDRFGIYNPLLQSMGAESKTHPDELVFALLAAGFNTLCYDGQFFFDTDHPVELQDGSIGSWSNFQGGSGTAWYLLDTRRPIKPLIFQDRKPYKLVAMQDDNDEAVFTRDVFRYGVDARNNVGYGLPHLAYASRQTLDITNYSAARAAMGSLKGDKGKPLAISGNLLLVPPSLEKAAKDVVAADRLANGATNVMANTAEVMVAPWLA